MKKFYIFILLFISLTTLLEAQIEENLRHYTPGSEYYYNHPDIDLQLARFEPVAPCFIKRITIKFTGAAGSARVRLFGYEAGGQLPELQNNVIPPITIQKTAQGSQSVAIDLQEPLWFDNSWFWIAVDQMTPGMYLLTDNVEKEIPYDTYFYQFLHVQGQDPPWSAPKCAYLIDILVSYSTKTSDEILQDFTFASGFEDELISLCIAGADYNGDDYIDLYFNNKLYKNNGNGSFTNVTEELGVYNKYNSTFQNTHQSQSFVDIDNDADLDIVSFGPDTSVVFINTNGKFEEFILSLPRFPTFGYSPLLFNWADINNDGFPDFCAVQQASKYIDSLPSYVFINDQNNDFIDESARMFPPNYIFRRARASQFGDFDNDGDQDLYIANYYLERDQLYENNGEGFFVDISPQKNLDIHATSSQHGCGVNLFDYDNDLDLDIVVARIAHARFVMYDHRGTGLYRNEGPPNYNFTDLTGQYNNYPGQISPVGLEYEDYHSSAAFADVNNDGLPDLLLKTYNPYRFISFYEQQPDHTFKMARFKYGLDRMDSRQAGQVWLDYNNDGKIDLAMINTDKISLFRNTVKNGKNSVEINLRCTSGNKFAIGGRAYVHSGDKTFMREVVCGQDEWVQFPYRLHFGLGDIQVIDSVVVLWPTKPQKSDVFRDLFANNIYTLVEGGAISSTPVGIQYVAKYKIITNAYPNPFTDRSIIKYVLEKGDRVILKIYDGLGNEIRTLVDEVQQAGEYQAEFNAQGLAQGSYYYKLIIGDKVVGDKLILVK
ncbi:FG-GAP-like repeat-containing protein [Bacteroidota bacterium]